MDSWRRGRFQGRKENKMHDTKSLSVAESLRRHNGQFEKQIKPPAHAAPERAHARRNGANCRSIQIAPRYKLRRGVGHTSHRLRLRADVWRILPLFNETQNTPRTGNKPVYCKAVRYARNVRRKNANGRQIRSVRVQCRRIQTRPILSIYNDWRGDAGAVYLPLQGKKRILDRRFYKTRNNLLRLFARRYSNRQRHGIYKPERHGRRQSPRRRSVIKPTPHKT